MPPPLDRRRTMESSAFTSPEIPPAEMTPGAGLREWRLNGIRAGATAVERELYTWANLVTGIRIVVAFGLIAIGWQTGLLRWSLYALVVYWVGDLLDGWLARVLRQETLLGAQFDILADRILVTLFYANYAAIRPAKAIAALAFLFEFAVLDTYLSNQFTRWPVLSPNYFYVVDRESWRWLWSKPAKAFNCGLVTLLLIGLPSQWPALAVTLVLIAIRLRFAHRMLLLTDRLPAPPPAPER
jgi:CDP-diacylglycerol--glycerol-3-phosphate 3-phosphatidyltransferase